jgi:alpha-beta hydrolase superfamily lysophospholipase
MVIVHGLGEHGGRYRVVATELAKSGWATLVPDLYGHGESPGRRGHAPSYFGTLQDIHAARETAAALTKSVPQVLLGHSMGGNLVANYGLRRSEFPRSLPDLRGMILSAPMFLPTKPPTRSQIFAAWLTGYLVPWFTVKAPVDTSKLTKNPDTIRKLRDDPLMHGRISVYLATQLLAQGRWALDSANSIDLPTLVMHGEEDPITSFRASESFAMRGGEQVEFKSFPAMLHEIFHETNAEIVFDCLRDWLLTLHPSPAPRPADP